MYVRYDNTRVFFSLSIGEAEKVLLVLEKFQELNFVAKRFHQERRLASVLKANIQQELIKHSNPRGTDNEEIFC